MLKHYNVTEKKKSVSNKCSSFERFLYQIILQAKVALKHAVTLFFYFLKHGGDSNALIR